MSDQTIEALIIRNIAELDAASKILERKLKPALFRSIERIVEEWADERGWGAKCDWDEDQPYVFPSDWQRTNDDDEEPYQEAWFQIYEREAKDDPLGEPSSWIAQLCGIGGSVGFWFDWLKGNHGYTGRRWKVFAASYVPRLQQAGFSYDESSGLFFVPVRVVPEDLAQAIEGDTPEDALTPVITAALDKCYAAKPIFDEIVAAAKQQQGPPSP